MKRNIIEHLMLALTVSAFTIFEGCHTPSPPTTQSPETPTPTRSTPAPDTPTPSPQANLRITDVRVDKSNQGNDYRIVAVDVKNDGDGVASGFNIECSWKCPPGGTVISWGTSVEQAGYIGGHGQFTYRRDTRIGCIGPPAILNFECIIYPKGMTTGPVINKWSGQINIPF